MYLPLVALIAMVVLALWRIAGSRVQTARGRGARGRARGRTTAARNREYATGLSLAQTIVDRRPIRPGAPHAGRTTGQRRPSGRRRGAVADAPSIWGTRGRGYQLGRVLLAKGDAAGATQQFDAVVKLDGVPQPLRWLEPPRIEVLTSRLLLGQILRHEPAVARGRSAGARGAGRGCRATSTPGACWPRRFAGQQRWPESITGTPAVPAVAAPRRPGADQPRRLVGGDRPDRRGGGRVPPGGRGRSVERDRQAPARRWRWSDQKAAGRRPRDEAGVEYTGAMTPHDSLAWPSWCSVSSSAVGAGACAGSRPARTRSAAGSTPFR